jgi:tRNA pseudouridine55 synthase
MTPDAYILLDKKVGQTPLEVAEAWRATRPDMTGVPLAYAGRLDPMASGKLLVLLGEECKKQAEYHDLDKEYQVEILFGVGSDSGDVLGRVTEAPYGILTEATVAETLAGLVGDIELPYPVFSAKTVQGKPLHTWAIENRLHEITIPTRHSTVFKMSLLNFTTKKRQEVYDIVSHKIELIPPVTDPRKALGNDFRRPEVRATWKTFKDSGNPSDAFYIATFSCICSSGTYMRTLAEVTAEKLSTKGLAFSIHRSKIGTYNSSTGTWAKVF